MSATRTFASGRDENRANWARRIARLQGNPAHPAGLQCRRNFPNQPPESSLNPRRNLLLPKERTWSFTSLASRSGDSVPQTPWPGKLSGLGFFPLGLLRQAAFSGGYCSCCLACFHLPGRGIAEKTLPGSNLVFRSRSLCPLRPNADPICSRASSSSRLA
jgi:hypothetical protein